MKREIGAIALLMALLLLSGWNLRKADFLTDAIGRNLTRAERALERGDEENALTAFDSAEELWRAARVYTGVFLRHPDLDAISDAFFELRQLLQTDPGAAPAAFGKLRCHLETLDRMEHLSLETVF